MIKGEPILISLVDDDPAHSEAVRRALKASGMNVVIQPAGTLKEYREIAAAHQPDIAILDLSLPDGRAVEVLISPPEAGPFPIVVIISQGDELLAVEAMKAGALDYIVKSPEAFAGMPRTVERVLHEWGMLQERKRAEEALRESEERYRTLIENVGEGIGFVNPEEQFAFANAAAEDIFGVPPRGLLGRSLLEFARPEQFGMIREQTDRRRAGEKSVYEIEIIRPNGKKRNLLITAVSQFDSQGQFVGTLGVFRDITELKRTEEALRRAEENFRYTLDDSPLGVCIVTAEGETIYANRAILDIYGYDSIEELRTTSIKNRYTPESYAEFQIRHNKRPQGEEAPSEYEISIVKKNGEVHQLQVFRKEVLWNGEKQYQALYRDITEHKQAEEVIRASLREKEVLLREIHHRVKNNMQIISSLFNLQAGYIKDEEALRILKEGQTRIRSMALVHEKLYQSGDLSKIDLAGYIQSLSTHLFHVYLVDPNQVRLETEFGDVTLDINSAVPCGLILNELISNALKHAFPAGRKGVLMIRLQRRKDGAVELRIADNGVGFPKGLDFRRTESLGLQIVSLLVGQLEGTIKLDGKNGTAFTVAFHETKRGLRT